MPDETTRTVTVDGVTWTLETREIWSYLRKDGWSGFASHDECRLVSRIAALEAEREEIEDALNDLPNSYTESVPSSINSLLSWHRVKKKE